MSRSGSVHSNSSDSLAFEPCCFSENSESEDERLLQRDMQTRSERTFAFEKQVMESMDKHNHANRKLKERESEWMPGVCRLVEDEDSRDKNSSDTVVDDSGETQGKKYKFDIERICYRQCLETARKEVEEEGKNGDTVTPASATKSALSSTPSTAASSPERSPAGSETDSSKLDSTSGAPAPPSPTASPSPTSPSPTSPSPTSPQTPEEGSLTSSSLDFSHPSVIDRAALNFELEFVESGGKPVIVTNIAKTENWPALEKWSTPEAITKFYGEIPIHMTEMCGIRAHVSGHGKALGIRIPIREYIEYAKTNTADFPYYPFERDFLNEGRKQFLNDWTTPKLWLNGDLYEEGGEETREMFPFTCHRFLLLGGKRTGANIHQDPKGSCAWNTLIAGRKRWIFFPPSVEFGDLVQDKEVAVEKGGEKEVEKEVEKEEPAKDEKEVEKEENAKTVDDKGEKKPNSDSPKRANYNAESAVHWWIDQYPRIINTPGLAEKLGMVECIQEKDETIWIPPGWWHAVLNIEDFTVACTSNTMTRRMLKQQRPAFDEKYPEVIQRFEEVYGEGKF